MLDVNGPWKGNHPCFCWVSPSIAKPLIPENRFPKKLLPRELLATLAGSVATAAFAMAGLTPAPANAVSLDQACSMFAAKIQAALSAGDTAKAQMIFSEGSQRIASRFNGASCPNIQAP